MRILDTHGVVSLFEPLDTQNGIDSDSFHIGRCAHADLLIQFGAVTGDSVLTVYCGATAGTKTTAVPFRYRLSSGDYKAASADLFTSSDTTDADGALTLTAATYDHRVLAIMLDAAEIPDSKPWITVEIDATASVLLMSGFALLSKPRNAPALTAIA
jgi:hypothetical protein